MKRKFLIVAAALMGCMQMSAQSVKIHGVLEMNRYDDGDQMKSEYLGWDSDMGKAIFIVDNGLYSMTWDGTTLSTPTKDPAIVKSEITTSEQKQWVTDFNLMYGNSGAVFVDNKLITVMSRDEQSTTDDELFAVRKWDAVTGNLESGRSDFYPKSATLESAGMAYNPLDGEVYGLFYLTGQSLPSEITDDPDYFEDQDADMTDGDAGYCLCRVDLTTMKVYPITPGLYYYNFITFAINSEGRAFALTSGGSNGYLGDDGKIYNINNQLAGAQLCEFDLTTGLMKTNAVEATDPDTGETYTSYENIYEHGIGYCAQYHRQAACFAASNPNKMYWIGDYNSGKGVTEWGSWSSLPDKEWKTNGKYDTALYEVDITTGNATRVAKVANRCRFSALWIDSDDASIGSDYWTKDHSGTVTPIPSGITEFSGKTATASDEYYNLNGQRVSNPVRGLYIAGGRKVVIK